MKKENKIQTEILDYLKGNPKKKIPGIGGFWLNFHGGDPYMPAGLPDIIGCLNGRFVAFEVKRHGEKPRAIQEKTIELLRRSGAYVFVVTSADEVRKTLNDLEE